MLILKEKYVAPSHGTFFLTKKKGGHYCLKLHWTRIRKLDEHVVKTYENQNTL